MKDKSQLFGIYIYKYIYIYIERKREREKDIIEFCVCVVGSYTTSLAGARSLQGVTYLLTKWFIVLHFETKNLGSKQICKQFVDY